MTDVTRDNFGVVLSELKVLIPQTTFVTVDLEFTGLVAHRCPDISLFDSPKERYNILRESCKEFAIIQFGLSLFQYDSVEREYACKTYNFYVFPRSYKHLSRQMLFDSSACDFLMKYDFDINKCFYGGVSHLNENELQDVTSDCNRNPSDIVLNNVKQEFKIRKLSHIKSWCKDAIEGETLTVDCFSSGMRTVLAYEVCKALDCIVTYENPCVPDETELLLKKVLPSERLALRNSKEHREIRELQDAKGFMEIFRLLKVYKKPLIGHNVFFDLLFLYQKFYKNLPNCYYEFKRELHKTFPIIFDTKHIINNLKIELRKDEVLSGFFKSSTLQMLYEEATSQKIMQIMYQPAIKPNFELNTGIHEHCAGFDSFITGTVFIRLSHFYAARHFHTPSLKPFHFNDYLRELGKFKNCINLIRCSSTHVNLIGEDPGSIRPDWLIVTSRDSSEINERQVAYVLSSFGRVDVRKRSRFSCLVALPSVGISAGLLIAMEDHQKYVVRRFSPRFTIGFDKISPLFGISIPLIITAILYTCRRNFAHMFNR